MAERSSIEWTDATWNPVRGCTRVSPGCGGPGRAGGCYAEIMAARFSDPGQWGHGFAERVNRPDGTTTHRWTGRVAAVENQLTLPLKWKSPKKIFVNSTSDLFHEDLPHAAIDRIFATMIVAPQHTYQVLTKRAERMRAYLSDPNTVRRIYSIVCDMVLEGQAEGVLIAPGINPSSAPPGRRIFLDVWPLPNVWLGVSAEDQTRADERIPHLLATPAAVRFVSAEPLLGPIDLRRLRVADLPYAAGFPMADSLAGQFYMDPEKQAPFTRALIEENRKKPQPPDGIGLDQVIVGGESGKDARPMHPDWVRSIRDQCAAAQVPFFFKQWGEWEPASDDRGHTDSNMETNGARWVHLDGLVNGPSWHRAEKREDTEPYAMALVGKKRAGRLLDGVEHNGMPEVRQ